MAACSLNTQKGRGPGLSGTAVLTASLLSVLGLSADGHGAIGRMPTYRAPAGRCVVTSERVGEGQSWLGRGVALERVVARVCYRGPCLGVSFPVAAETQGMPTFGSDCSEPRSQTLCLAH